MLCHVRMKNLCSGWSREQFWRSAGQQPWSRHSKATWPWRQGKKLKMKKPLKKLYLFKLFEFFALIFLLLSPGQTSYCLPLSSLNCRKIFDPPPRLLEKRVEKKHHNIYKQISWTLAFWYALWFAGTSYFWILGRYS